MFFIPDPETGGIEITSPIASEGHRLLNSGFSRRSPERRRLRHSVNKTSLRPHKHPYWSVQVPGIAYLQDIVGNLYDSCQKEAAMGRHNAAACVGQLATEMVDFIATLPLPDLPAGTVAPDDISELPPLQELNHPDTPPPTDPV